MATISAKLNEIDDKDAWGGEITQLPPGEYQFKVKEADVEQKEDGQGADGSPKIKSQLVVNFEVISGPFAGKTIKSWFGLDFTKDGPRKRLKALVLATNCPVSADGSFDSSQLPGCKLNADVTHQSYDAVIKDPVMGTEKKETKTSIRVVNERPFRDVAAPVGGNVVSGGSKAPGLTATAAKLPGLTPA